MKKILTLVALGIVLASCTKKDDVKPTSVPTIVHRDTLTNIPSLKR